MKVFTRDYRVTGDFSKPFEKYFGGMHYCVLDIETTGLNRENCKVILVGLLTQTDSGIRVTQFLAENHYEEYKVLDAVLDFFEEESVDYIITYNGAAFDIPFLNARLDANFSGCSLKLYDFDLYRFIKLGTDLKSRIGSLSQKSVENYYGILDDRGDTITGRESVTIFDEYSLTGNSTLEKIILTHNREDVLHLHRLMHLVLADVDEMDSALACYGFPIMNGNYIVRAEIKKTGRGSNAGRILRAYGDQLSKPFSAAFFPDADSPIYASFNASSSFFEIEVPVSSAVGIDGSLYLDIKALGLDASTELPVYNNSSEYSDIGINDEYPANSMNSGYSGHNITGFDSGYGIKDDPDYVNGFLILNPRTINRAAALITTVMIKRSRT